MIKKINAGRICGAVFLCFTAALCAAVLVFSRHFSECVLRASELCVKKVVPSVFPFMVLSGILVSSGAPEIFASAAGKTLRKLFGVSENAAACIILGTFCGFPSGGKTVSDLCEKGMIQREEADRLLPACNLCGPAFVLSFGNALGDHAGAVLAAIQIFSSAVFLVLTDPRRKKVKKTSFTGKEREPIQNGQTKTRKSIPEIVTGCVKESVFSVCAVCGFVILFYIVNDFISPLTALLPRSAAVLVRGFSEITCGMASLSGIAPGSALPVAAAIICFGGISAAFQTFAVSKEGVSVKKYFFGKAVMALIGAASAAVYALIAKVY